MPTFEISIAFDAEEIEAELFKEELEIFCEDYEHRNPIELDPPELVELVVPNKSHASTSTAEVEVHDGKNIHKLAD